MVARCTQALDEVQPVEAGYHPIDNQQIETIAHCANETLRTACHLGDQVAFLVKAVRDVVSVLSVVLNEQDLQAASRSPASVPPFGVLGHEKHDFQDVKLQNPNVTEM